jgi:hypothetical protein
LAAPDRATTETLIRFFALYAGVHLVAGAVFGSRWFESGDGFEVYSSLIGRLALLGRRVDGRLVLRNPLDGLDGLEPKPGLVASVCIVLGSTAFDGLSNAPWWIQRQQDSPFSPSATATLGLLATIIVVATAYAIAVRLASFLGATVLGATPHRARALPATFAHSVVPIAVGYLIAHYFSLLVFEGQRTLILVSDPLASGANLFGTDDHQVNFSAVSPETIAAIQVAAVLAGHLIGVVSAHDRAVRLFPRSRAITGQIPMLGLMVAYTVGGLTLLFAG